MEKEIDELIASCSTLISTFLQFLKETGARGIEAQKSKWTDIDQERRNIRITPAKGSNPRILPISQKLIGMLNNLPKDKPTIFSYRLKSLRDNYNRQRTRASIKLNNPRINEIHFHTFRHWKGTMEYHKTLSIMHVKQILGHKTIESTQIYINLEQATFLNNDDTEYVSLVTHTITEEQQAIEKGWTLVRPINETTALYRKRK